MLAAFTLQASSDSIWIQLHAAELAGQQPSIQMVSQISNLLVHARLNAR